MREESNIYDDYRNLQEKFQQVLLMNMARDSELQYKNLQREIEAHKETQHRLEKQTEITREATMYSADTISKLKSLVSKYEFAFEVLETMDLSDAAQKVVNCALNREEYE